MVFDGVKTMCTVLGFIKLTLQCGEFTKMHLEKAELTDEFQVAEGQLRCDTVLLHPFRNPQKHKFGESGHFDQI